MYLRDLLKALRQRWYLVAVGILVTAGLGYLALSAVSPTYTATTSMLLIPPKNSVGARGNPYLNLQGLARPETPSQLASWPIREAQEIIEKNPNAEITVGADITTSGPILLIAVSTRSSQESVLIRDRIAMAVSPTLDNMQKDLSIPPSSRITISTLASDPKPTKSAKDQLRAVIVAVGVGVSATIIGTGVLDAFLTRRRSQSEAALNREDAVEESPGAANGSGIGDVQFMPKLAPREVDQPSKPAASESLPPNRVEQPSKPAASESLPPNRVEQPSKPAISESLPPNRVEQPSKPAISESLPRTTSSNQASLPYLNRYLRTTSSNQASLPYLKPYLRTTSTNQTTLNI